MGSMYKESEDISCEALLSGRRRPRRGGHKGRRGAGGCLGNVRQAPGAPRSERRGLRTAPSTGPRVRCVSAMWGGALRRVRSRQQTNPGQEGASACRPPSMKPGGMYLKLCSSKTLLKRTYREIQTERKSWQIIHLIKDSDPKYLKNSQNSIIRKQLVFNNGHMI